MTADEIRAMYRDFCQMPFKIRRYSGQPRAKVDTDVVGHIRLYSGKELVGTIVQGDVAVIVLVDDLVAEGFQLPITTADKVFDGRERAIQAPIGERKSLDGTLIAYELQARG